MEEERVYVIVTNEKTGERTIWSLSAEIWEQISCDIPLDPKHYRKEKNLDITISRIYRNPYL